MGASSCRALSCEMTVTACAPVPELDNAVAVGATPAGEGDGLHVGTSMPCCQLQDSSASPSKRHEGRLQLPVLSSKCKLTEGWWLADTMAPDG